MSSSSTTTSSASPLDTFMRRLLIKKNVLRRRHDGRPPAIDIIFDNANSRSVAFPLSPKISLSSKKSLPPGRANSLDRWAQLSPTPSSKGSTVGTGSGDSSSSSLSSSSSSLGGYAPQAEASPVCPIRKDYLDKFDLMGSPDFIRRSSRNLIVAD